jgi:hypothetical protein
MFEMLYLCLCLIAVDEILHGDSDNCCAQFEICIQSIFLQSNEKLSLTVTDKPRNVQFFSHLNRCARVNVDHTSISTSRTLKFAKIKIAPSPHRTTVGPQ